MSKGWSRPPPSLGHWEPSLGHWEPMLGPLGGPGRPWEAQIGPDRPISCLKPVVWASQTPQIGPNRPIWASQTPQIGPNRPIWASQTPQIGLFGPPRPPLEAQILEFRHEIGVSGAMGALEGGPRLGLFWTPFWTPLLGSGWQTALQPESQARRPKKGQKGTPKRGHFGPSQGVL